MITHQIAMGDDVEFALEITDPISGETVDMATRGDWEVWFSVGGSDILLVRSTGDLATNQSHPDPNVPDGSLRVRIPQELTAEVSPGAHRVYAKLRDSEGQEHTVLNGREHVFNFYLTPLTNL